MSKTPRKNFELKFSCKNNFQRLRSAAFFNVPIYKIRRKKVIAFAGIAHPKNFFNLLDNQNINLIDTISFPDHYKYKKNDIKNILLLCKKNSAIPVTTYKDYVKIPDNLKKDFSVINIYIKFDKEKFFSFINKKIKFNV